MNIKVILCCLTACAAIWLTVRPASATNVDATLTNTSQIISATNNPFFGAGSTTDVAGVNLYFTNSIGSSSSLNGIFFDNINMGSPPSGTVNLTANQPGITLTVTLLPTRDNSARTLSPSITGTDSTVANRLLSEVSFIGATGNNNPGDTFTFSGLAPSQNVYVQTVGGDQPSWAGPVQVNANGSTVGTWTSTTSGPALYGFETTTDASGHLELDYSVPSGNYAGLAGIMILGQAEAVPEPSTWCAGALLALGLFSHFVQRRRAV
jgi:hypothetical protein